MSEIIDIKAGPFRVLCGEAAAQNRAMRCYAGVMLPGDVLLVLEHEDDGQRDETGARLAESAMVVAHDERVIIGKAIAGDLCEACGKGGATKLCPSCFDAACLGKHSGGIDPAVAGERRGRASMLAVAGKWISARGCTCDAPDDCALDEHADDCPGTLERLLKAEACKA